MTLARRMKHWGCEAYQVCSNDGPRLTLTYLRSRSNLHPYAFKCFLKTAEAKAINII